METSKGFEEEVLHTEVEETTESAAEGAIDVSTEPKSKGVTIFTEKIIMPVIPDTLVINGISVNNDDLEKTLNKEILTMTIKDLNEKEGLKAAELKLSELSKLRTGSETWRTKTVMPSVNTFGKELKAKIDKTGEICSKGETYLKGIIAPIKKAAELALEREETAKDELAKTRTAELIAVGGVHDGVGTINFPLDPGLFVLSEDLRTWVEDTYLEKYYEAKRLFDDEQTRLQAIEDEKSQEALNLKSQVEDLNAERTEFRKEQLEMKGFDFNDERGFYNDKMLITEEQIRTLDAASWKALLNPPVVEVAEVKEELPEVKPAPSSSHAMNQNYNPFAGVSSGFDVEETETPEELPVFDAAFFTEEETTSEVEETPAPVEKVITRTLVFSESKPFVEFVVGNGFNMLIFPKEYEQMIPTEDMVGSGSINEQLKFQLIKA